MTKIEWTDETWNPIGGCSRVSTGCERCYAERMAWRAGGANGDGRYAGLVKWTQKGPTWTGTVRVYEDRIDQPLKWRKPRMVFVNSMGDLFHEAIDDETIDRILSVMWRCPQHTFQILTKRADRMRDYFLEWKPLSNVWLGVSAEDQRTADTRIPALLETPAAVRFVSFEPLLAPVILRPQYVDWIIIGGESGPGARPCDVAWIRLLAHEAREAGVATFVKQLGSRPLGLRLRSRKGSDPAEWPEDLRVRQMPAVR